MSERPRSQPETQAEADEARSMIHAYWPEHEAHLSPEGNRMGSGAITEHGVVCNCGEVLGHPPAPTDPEEYLAQSDNVGDEATPWEAGWNDMVAAGDAGAPEAAEGPPYAVGDKVTVGGIEFTKHSEEPFPDSPPWDTSDGPGPTKLDNYRKDRAHYLAESGGGLAKSVRGKAETVDELWNHPAAQAVVAEGNRDAEMRDRFERNPHDPEARAWVLGHETATGDPVEEHAARKETVDLPPIPDERNDMYAVSPRGTLPAPVTGSGVIPQDPLSARVVTIDPTKPYGPQDVELQLLEVENKLERGMHAQRYWEERSAAAEMEWEIIYNKARAKVIGFGGSEKDRHALCLQDPDVELAYRERHLAAAMVRMMRESMHNLRSLQSGYQTLSRSVENTYRGRQPGA